MTSNQDDDKKGDKKNAAKGKSNFSSRELRNLLTDTAHKKWVCEFDSKGIEFILVIYLERSCGI